MSQRHVGWEGETNMVMELGGSWGTGGLWGHLESSLSLALPFTSYIIWTCHLLSLSLSFLICKFGQ